MRKSGYIFCDTYYYIDVYFIPTLCVGGNVWFRNTTTPNITERALFDIRQLYNVADIDHTVIATWENITLKDSMKVSLNFYISNFFLW